MQRRDQRVHRRSRHGGCGDALTKLTGVRHQFLGEISGRNLTLVLALNADQLPWDIMLALYPANRPAVFYDPPALCSVIRAFGQRSQQP